MSGLDRLSAVLEQFPVQARLHHAGPLCGNTWFDPVPGRAFLHLLRRGTLRVVHDGREGEPSRLECVEPTLLFYPRALGHRFETAPRDGADFTCAAVFFAGGDGHPIARALPPVVAVPLAAIRGLEGTLELLFAEAAQTRCGSRLLVDRLFEVLVVQLLRWLLDQQPATVGLVAGLGDRRLARALTAVHEAPCAEWTVERLAEVAGMSRSAFAAHFHAVVGLTPADYVAEWRITRACRLLREGKPLATVADLVGYSGYAALSRAFRRRRGLSPREWRRAHAEAPGRVPEPGPRSWIEHKRHYAKSGA
ncbi:cupin domain-containing protein [Vulcaniibacterium thermophilum]|uniref:AraC family transcriptional regulator n=1 Tax=Vulcaniibacterium thermophilum TaxID=1169913 RepID=A0A918Z228_9GAMM|nr:AraC family transcriptional regulator [Vulcaniibacterium thermophilum]GHE33911.1 AraC family transcriptional regulator [Vulcaniibacterium thermophilum]